LLTAKYLKPIQLFGRIWFKYYQPKPDLKPAPNTTNPTGNWAVPACRLPSIFKTKKFRFLNIDGDLCEIGWDGPQREKLWRYNQHYFDDLNSINADDRKEWHKQIIEDWINCNPPGFGTGWEPYPVSLRIVNLIKWNLRKNKLSSNAKQSLAIQLRWLSKRLEIHLLGNHLFSNAKALVFGGLFFEGKEADKWLKKGLGILNKEIQEQILPDGGHFELSTMYHALAFEDILDLINVSKCFSDRFNIEQSKQVLSWSGVAEKMHFWLDTMCHPDGEISFFNDSAFDVAPDKSELDAYANKVLDTELKKSKYSEVHHTHSGYLKIIKKESVAFLDVAKVGPDYLPGHAHADTLSFEWSIGKHRVIVNSGTSCYSDSRERLRQRGTASHNTVVVNRENSSEVWGGFRVARRAYPIELKVLQNKNTNATQVHCSHDGYFRLTGKPKHSRKWMMNEESFFIEDHVVEKTEEAEARFHFHPDVQVRHDGNKNSGTIQLLDGKSIVWTVIEGAGNLVESTWHPRFGISIPNICLVIKLYKGVSKINFRYSTS
jgi:uncharacterized heparinase superfamily protein